MGKLLLPVILLASCMEQENRDYSVLLLRKAKKGARREKKPPMVRPF
jgi:hypothetical protein